MNQRHLLAACLLLFIGFSCKKSDPVIAAVPYLSINSGNVWSYELTNNPSTAPTNTNYTLTSSIRDTTINSKIYHIFNNSNGNTLEYLNQTGSDYFEFSTLPAALGGGKTENLYLKSNVAIATTWSQALPPITISGITANVLKSDTLKETGLTKIVKGKTYTNVIHVSSGLTITSSTSPIPLNNALTASIHNYYAPNVGRIYSSNDIKIVVTLAGINQSVENKTELVSTNF